MMDLLTSLGLRYRFTDFRATTEFADFFRPSLLPTEFVFSILLECYVMNYLGSMFLGPVQEEKCLMLLIGIVSLCARACDYFVMVSSNC